MLLVDPEVTERGRSPRVPKQQPPTSGTQHPSQVSLPFRTIDRMEPDLSARNSERLDTHAVWEALDELGSALDVKLTDGVPAAKQVADAVARAHSITAITRATLRAVDPPRAIFADVDAVSAAASGAKSSLDQLHAGTDVATQLDNHLDQLQRATATVLTTSVSAPDTDTMADLHGTRKRGDQLLSDFADSIEAAEDMVDKATERIEALTA